MPREACPHFPKGGSPFRATARGALEVQGQWLA